MKFQFNGKIQFYMYICILDNAKLFSVWKKIEWYPDNFLVDKNLS